MAAVTQPEQAGDPAAWRTYIRVERADDAAERVRAAGGAILTEPFDAGDAGRMAVFADCEGAVFRVWEPKQHKGAAIVNEHGSVNFNTLHTRDMESAKAFYRAVFGWDTLELGPGMAMWTLPGYGDHLEAKTPGTARADGLGRAHRPASRTWWPRSSPARARRRRAGA